MRHFFFTRIAVEGKLIHPSYPNVEDAVIRDYIELWLNQSSKFYEENGFKGEVKVGLWYSRFYAHVLADYEFPDYVDLTTEHPAHWIRNNCVNTGQVTITRLDADDSYSVDLWRILEERLHNESQDKLILYKKIHQYDVETDTFYEPMWHSSPMFATIYRSDLKPFDADACIRKDAAPLLGIIGNHGKYHLATHDTPEMAYALMRITGWNKQNRLGLMGRTRNNLSPTSKGRHRFVGLGTRTTGAVDT